MSAETVTTGPVDTEVRVHAPVSGLRRAGQAWIARWRRRRQRIPVILQGEMSECGIAALAMITAAWGLKADLAALRAKLWMAPRGLNLRTIVQLSSGIGLAARPVRIGLHRLQDLQLPAMLHWRMDHFIVLEAVKRGRLHIIDPARGRRSLSLDEASDLFSGVAVEFSPTNQFEPGVLRVARTFRRAWFDDARLRAAAAKVLLLTAVFQSVLIGLPFLYRKLIDQQSVPTFAELNLAALGAGLVMLVLVQAGSSYARGLALNKLGSLFVHNISVNLLSHLFRLPTTFFHRQMAGDILARLRSVEVLRRFIGEQAAVLIVDVLVGLATATLMMLFSWQLGAIVLAGLVLDVTLRLTSFRKERDLSIDLLEAEGKELSRLLESLRTMQAVKLAGKEAERLALWNNDFVRVLNAQSRLVHRRAGVSAVSTAISTTEMAAILAVGALGVTGSPVSMGVLFGVLAYRGLFRERLNLVMNSMWSLQDVGIHMRRLDDIMLAEPEPEGGRVPCASMPYAIRIRNMSFGYGPNEPPVLEDVNLDIPAGACVAFVGPSGAGKSTLIKLLLGLEQPTSGEILIDDLPLKSLDRRVWRQVFGTVMQDDTLLSGSICDNISFFEPQMDMDRVRQVSRAAAIHDEIAAMPMGYNTVLGDLGAQISGGQRQRIMIARALYRQPKIILFDEGTANLDAASERRVADVLGSLAVTRIIVAHRSHLVDVADQVYELRDRTISRTR